MELPIASVVIGERSRREMRNIASLAESIRERGCLHPPVVRREGRDRYVLVAGARRLAAMKSLGYDKVRVTVTYNIADELAALYAEGEENTEREPFTPSEAVAHAERIEGVIAAAARERQANHGGTAPGRPKDTCADSAQVSPPGKTRDLVANGRLRPVDPTEPTHRLTISAAAIRRHLGDDPAPTPLHVLEETA